MPPEWLALFPEGGEIGPAGFDLRRFGKPALESPVPGANVGDYVVLDDGRGAMVDDKGYQPLDPFALAMLQNMEGPTERQGSPPATYLGSTFLSSHWPETPLTRLNSPPCAQLDVETGRVPHVWLAGDPQGDAISPELGAEGQIDPGDRRVTIDRGHGAFVLDGTWDKTTSGSPFVIDPLGKAYQVVDPPITLAKLGYDAEQAPVVPDEWVTLFDRGVSLSTYVRALSAGRPRRGPAERRLPRPAVMRLSARPRRRRGCRRSGGRAAGVCRGRGDAGGLLGDPPRGPHPLRDRPAEPPARGDGGRPGAEAAKKAHVVAGAGVTVAVIDSGVSPDATRIDIADTVRAGTLQPDPVYYHGTAIAGLIAGKPRRAAVRSGSRRALGSSTSGSTTIPTAPPPRTAPSRRSPPRTCAWGSTP